MSVKKVSKGVRILDWFILFAGIWLIHRMDFNNLTPVNLIFLGSFSVWGMLLLLRIVILLKGAKVDDSSEHEE